MDNEKKLKPSDDQKYLIFFLFTALFIVSFLALSGMIINQFVEDRGTYGDMFGMASALFSGLAFAGILITILMQRKELQLQRLDLELTREELKKSAEAQENISKLNSLSAELSANSILMEHYPILKKNGTITYNEDKVYNDLKDSCEIIIDNIHNFQEKIETLRGI